MKSFKTRKGKEVGGIRVIEGVNVIKLHYMHVWKYQQ
jgi:hypothetical protein